MRVLFEGIKRLQRDRGSNGLQIVNFQIFLTNTDVSTFLGPIVVFCRSGARAKTAKEALESLGYKKVCSYNRYYDNRNFSYIKILC